MGKIICAKCKSEIDEYVESCPVCGFMYVQDIVNLFFVECRPGMDKDTILKACGTDFKEGTVKDKRYKSDDSYELRYDKDCFGLSGTLWFVLDKTGLRRAAWYYVGKFTEESVDKTQEIVTTLTDILGKADSVDMQDAKSGEYRWDNVDNAGCAFECSIMDGWIHILISLNDK